MKKTLLFLALISSSAAVAQPAKVLICAPHDTVSANATLAALQKVYHDKIDVSDTITDAINNYEAVFLSLSWKYSFTKASGSILKKFLSSKKNLFVKGIVLGEDIEDSNGFWSFITVSRTGYEDVVVTVDTVIGENNTFTEGIIIPYAKGVVGSIFEVLSKAMPVLNAQSRYLDGFSFADKYETDSFKVILYYPPFDYNDDAFLARVICNYFGLCTPLVVKPTSENSPNTFSIFPNPAADILHIWSAAENPSLQLAELITETGSLISTFSLDTNAGHYDLDLSRNLSAGNYYLRLSSPKQILMRSIILLPK